MFRIESIDIYDDPCNMTQLHEHLGNRGISGNQKSERLLSYRIESNLTELVLFLILTLVEVLFKIPRLAR